MGGTRRRNNRGARRWHGGIALAALLVLAGCAGDPPADADMFERMDFWAQELYQDENLLATYTDFLEDDERGTWGGRDLFHAAWPHTDADVRERACEDLSEYLWLSYLGPEYGEIAYGEEQVEAFLSSREVAYTALADELSAEESSFYSDLTIWSFADGCEAQLAPAMYTDALDNMSIMERGAWCAKWIDGQRWDGAHETIELPACGATAEDLDEFDA